MLWRFKNSLFMLIAIFPPFTFVPFAIMAYKARSFKWLLTSIVYLVAFYAIFFVRTPLTIITFIFSWLLGIIHLLVVKNEYLDRLEKISKNIPEEIVSQEFQKENPIFNDYNDDYINQIKSLNVSIDDALVTSYLNELESVTANILYYVKKHPEKQSQTQDFLNYYLPETISLLKHYQELSQISLKTDNIKKAMQEILDALDVITNSFSNLYNDLFAERVLNISTDIKVLKDILQQNGLTKNKYDDFFAKSSQKQYY